MPRHRQSTPTEVELEILQVLWDRGPSTVREVVDELCRKRKRAYTSILSMLNVMLEKRMVEREERGRAHIYRARQPREKTLGGIVRDLLGRVFDGSANALISQVLDQSRPSEAELKRIRQAIETYNREEPD